jgi:predicted nucleic acid-binding protein
MNVLDTDSLSLLMRGHEGLRRRVAEADAVCITIITRIEILQGRFSSLLKAADGGQLQRHNTGLRKTNDTWPHSRCC